MAVLEDTEAEEVVNRRTPLRFPVPFSYCIFFPCYFLMETTNIKADITLGPDQNLNIVVTSISEVDVLAC